MALTSLRADKRWPDGFDKPSVDVPAGTVTHAGRVLKTFFKDERVMSDVWDGRPQNSSRPR